MRRLEAQSASTTVSSERRISLGSGEPMGSSVKLFLLLGLAAFSPAMAETPCPALQPGAPYPWTTDEFMSGDKWADMELDLDVKGKVQACRVLKSNMSREDGFFACASMQVQGQEEPVMKD